MVFDQPGVSQVQGRGWRKNRAPSENGKKLSVPAARGVGLGNEARAEAGEACEGSEAVPGAGVSRLGQWEPWQFHAGPHVCLLDVCLWLESQERLGGGDQPEGCCLLASETGGCSGGRGPDGGAEGRGQCCGLLGKQSPQSEMLDASLIGLVVPMEVRRTGWDLPTHEHGVAIHF